MMQYFNASLFPNPKVYTIAEQSDTGEIPTETSFYRDLKKCMELKTVYLQ